jgi:hypothetical protein
LTGKVFRGYLDAAGTSNGLGIGNPNAEFSPNVSTCCFASEGGTAKILWGFENGEVAITLANRVMDSSRIGSAKLIRCPVAEEHVGMVADAVWGADGNVFVSAGIDGRVKLWDSGKVRCLWTSELQEPELVSNPCTKVAFDAEHGIIAAALNSGDIALWFGLDSLYTVEPRADLVPSRVPEKIVIPAPLITAKVNPNMGQSQEFATFVLHNNSSSQLSLLTNRVDDCFFYRFNIELSAHNVVEQIRFGDEHAGSIRSIKPFITQNAASFILVGDELGCLNVYDWNAPSSVPMEESAISPIKQFVAYEDGSSITSIEWNSTILITGSSNGTIKVWDSLTFALLRLFTVPGSKPERGEWESVKQVILERNMLVVAAGDKVMSWKAGPIKKAGGKVIVRGVKNTRSNTLAKWRRERPHMQRSAIDTHILLSEQIDLYRDIADSKRDLEQEQKYRQQAYGREKDQLGSLNALGLNEREALEYVLMLSRDEEGSRHTGHSAPSSLVPTRSRPLSDAQIQVSPRFEAESITAGLSCRVGRSIASAANNSANDGFPAMSSSVSSVSSASRLAQRPNSIRSAWRTPMKSSPPSSSATSSLKASGVDPGLGKRGNMMPIEPRPLDEKKRETDEDRDLRRAIELSLAEARIRGEDVV